MRFWVRELSGWVLILFGLFVFKTSYDMLTRFESHLVEAGPLAFIGFVLFRGGIHLLKVALAARVCLHAQEIEAGKEPARPRPARLRTPLGR